MTNHVAALINALDVQEAREALHRCCASTAWVETMLTRRPFVDDATLFETADAVWRALDTADWLEAFGAHPRIGDGRGVGWSGDEQDGMRSASAMVRDRLHALNQRYEDRFGHVFLTCASGRSADTLLAELERRITNDVDMELQQAAEEQRKITRLRLRKLVTS